MFYKTEAPSDVISLLYNSYKNKIKELTGNTYTPIQAQIYKNILDNTIYSFSAPTSAGKSHLLRDLLDKIKNDIVIVVPSRSLIGEYLILLREHYKNDNSVLILEFVDDINKQVIVLGKGKKERYLPLHELIIDSLQEYISFKVELMHSLGFKKVTSETFARANNEIQVDNIAHSIILS